VSGQNITESIPLNIGNPATSGFWTNTQEDYDVAIGGLPFFMVPTDQNPYQRETAPYRKDQFDNGKEPGEQSLTGWWLRSQSSFHVGTGIKFSDPSGGEVSPYRFYDSQGVDVWTKGQVTLLKDTTQGHNVTTVIPTTGNTAGTTQQHIRTVRYSNKDAILLHDGYDVDRIDADGTLEHWVDYNSGTSDPVFGICDDGVYGYWVTNDAVSGKLEFNKKLISDGAGVAPTVMFTTPGTTVTSAVLEYVKDRIVACINNKVYEIAPNATILPSPVYTNPNTNYVYTSITASGPAIYTSGSSGIYSSIQKYTLSTSGTMPTLTQAVVAAELPAGEIVYKVFYYLGRMLIGTNKGVRVADINDQDGSLAYGPLLFESTQPVYDFAARDRFIWCASGVGTNAGLVRIDLGTTVEGETITGGYANQLRFAYANDLQYSHGVTNNTTAVSFIGTTNRLAFCTAKFGATNGYVYFEHATNLVSNGYLQTGAIRFGTLEPKNFKFVRARGNYRYGAMDIQTIDANNNIYNVITYNSSVGTPEAATTQPEGSFEYLSYKFTLSRSASDNSLGPVFKGYQVKALPATARQRLIQFPLWCFDIETDRYNVKTGYEGRAWERIQTLENIEKSGDIINVQDFTTGERVQAVIERVTFARRTPPNGNYSGFGGILTALVRTVL
jgi:hypothetical protein